jgi:hypothetical protein
LKKLHVAVSHLAVTDKMLSVNRGFFDPSVSVEIMSRASGKFSAALKSSCSQCLPLVFSKWRLVYFIDAEWLCIKEEFIISHCEGFVLKMADR